MLFRSLATHTVPATTPVPVRRLRPDVPDGLLRAIEGSMEQNREQRFSSCSMIQGLVGLAPYRSSRISLIHVPALEEAQDQEPELQTAEELISGVNGRDPDTIGGAGAVVAPPQEEGYPPPPPYIQAASPDATPAEVPVPTGPVALPNTGSSQIGRAHV